LYRLAVINEQVHINAIVFDARFKDLRVGRLKHDNLYADFLHNFSRDISELWVRIFSDALRFDHDD
tara:strand:+ start:404 stop:601 length:198 start_codon:yes stop_codon:yes gene_type:complete